MSLSDVRRRHGAAKGSITKATTQIEIQSKVNPASRDLAALRRVKDNILKAESAFEETIDHDKELEEDETLQVEEFSRSVQEATTTITTLLNECEAGQLYEDLESEICIWEDTDNDELVNVFEGEYNRLTKLLAAVRSHPGSRITEGMKNSVGYLQKRLTALRSKTKPIKSSHVSVPTDDSKSSDDTYSEYKKARTVPLPTFSGDLAEWRSFWARFKDYISKLKHITNDEKLSYLLDCLKDPEAQSTVKEALRNRDDFDKVEKLLNCQYDQPREVFTRAIKGLMSLPQFDYTSADLNSASQALSKFGNTIYRYGDKSASQLITGILESKMTSKLKENWKLHKPSEEVPSTEELLQFLLERKRVLGLTERETPKEKSTLRTPYSKPSHHKSGKNPQTNLHISELPPCSVCQNTHHLHSCPSFKEMDQQARFTAYRNANVCYNCLHPSHSSRQCPSRFSCRECGGRHHTLLHRPRQPQQSYQQAPQQPLTSQSQEKHHAQIQPQSTPVLTSLIPNGASLLCSFRAILEVEGRVQAVRGIIDTGSTLSFLTRRVANNLKAEKIPHDTFITGLAHSHATTSNAKVCVTIKSAELPSEQPFSLTAVLLTSITGDTPSNDLSQNRDNSFTNRFTLADPDFGKPGRVDLLLGQDSISNILRSGMVKDEQSPMYCFNTMFGWVVGGQCSHPSEKATVHICCKAGSDSELNHTLKAFWVVEEVPSNFSQYSTEDQAALVHFKDHVSRQKDGRYTVALPRKDPTPTLGSSRPQAMRRYLQNKSSLTRKGKWQDFDKAVKEYSVMGHAEPVPVQDLDKPADQCFYMTMHGILKESSSTTKLRVVFDASAQTTSGFSFNQTLLQGPSLYPKLVDVLLEFRNHKIGMSSDISKCSGR